MKNVLSVTFLWLSIVGFAFVQPVESGVFSIQPELENNALELAAKWDKESNAQAISLYLESSAGWMKANNSGQAAANLLEAGRQNIVSGDRRQAGKLFRNALDLLKNSSNDGLKASLFGELSHLSFEAGKISESKQFIEKALVLAEKSKDFSALGDVYYVKGLYNYFNDDEEKAIVFYQKSEENYRKAEKPSAAIKSNISLGYVYILQSEFQKSLDLLNRALAECGQINDRRGTALTYKAIGSVYKQMYDYPKATEYFQKAEQLFPEGLDMDEKAMLYNWLGSLYEDYGNWSLSLNYRQKAYKFFSSSNHTYGQMATLISEARLENLLGENAAAMRDLEQADFYSRTIKDNFYAASIAEGKSSIYINQNNFAEAFNALEKALKLYDAKLYQREIARVHIKLGRILAQQNQFSEAVRHFNISLDLSRKVKDTLTESQTLYDLAKVNFTAGKAETALELIEKSIAETESSSSDLFNAKLKSLYLSNVYERYELYIKVLMKSRSKNSDSTGKALQIAEMSRARLVLENISLSGTNFLKDAAPETIEKEKNLRMRLNYKADKLTDSLSANAGRTEIDKFNNEILELEHELEEIKGTLKQNSPIYSAIKNPAPFDVAAFQRDVLDENSVLLEFSFSTDESYLWLVGKNFVESYTLPPREQLESSIEKLRKLIDSRGMSKNESVEDYQTRIAASEGEFDRESQIFSRALLGQVAGKISGKRLIIVPDGKLHYFPIAALPFPDSTDNQPILLTNETIYEPSAATLALLTRNGKTTIAAPRNLLVFSDPIFSVQDSRVTSAEIKPEPETVSLSSEKFRFAESLTSLPRLNASKDEADSIIEIIGTSDSTALNGAAATRESALDASVGDYKIIHFATHGLINEERPELSGIVLSQVDGSGQSRNGVVRLQDIYGMNLTADAVILSACSTGIGKEVKGEGLMSLNNAFLQTGAKSVVSSLWKVDDYAAQETMKNFYREMSSGTKTTAEALRNAQISLRRNPQYQSPFYWAAFTVEGDFRNVPLIAKSFDARIYGLLMLPFALIGWLIYRRCAGSFNRKIINEN